MPKGRKRTPEEYNDEMKEASKRMRKHKEARRSARDDDTWQEFLLDTIGINPNSISPANGQKFWSDVQADVLTYDRVTKYAKLREAGFTAKQARRMRDWSEEKRQVAIENREML